LQSKYLRNYLEAVEDTESPRLFHVWAALSAVSASLGRRCWLPFGPAVIYPNQFVLLVGHPGTRKSAAMNFARKRVSNATNVRFAPQDTSGQRQGLVKAMGATPDERMELNGRPLSEDEDLGLGVSIDDLMNVTDGKTPEEAVASQDKHHMYVATGEFTQLIGQNNFQMLQFLLGMWDGDEYEYQLKNEFIKLENPLMNILGCTTPASIAASMPNAADGQGFLSRVILVNGSEKYKLVPRPTVPDSAKLLEIEATLTKINTDFHGAFTESPAAFKFSEELYSYAPQIVDSRFASYVQRRYTHLLKLGMILAACRKSMQIEVEDYEEAQEILRITEMEMPDALGQFGLSLLSQVKQDVLEFIRRVDGPVPLKTIRSVYHKDVKMRELDELLGDLLTANLLVREQVNKTGEAGEIIFMAVKQSKETTKTANAEELLQNLIEAT